MKGIHAQEFLKREDTEGSIIQIRTIAPQYFSLNPSAIRFSYVKRLILRRQNLNILRGSKSFQNEFSRRTKTPPNLRHHQSPRRGENHADRKTALVRWCDSDCRRGQIQ